MANDLLSNVEQEVKAFEERAINDLKKQGYRITMPRVQVIRALADTRKPLGAYAIHQKIIDTNGKIDVVSVYRIVNTLQEVGVIHAVTTGEKVGYVPCRLKGCLGKHTQLLVNEDCTVEEFEISGDVLAAIEKQIGKDKFGLAKMRIEMTIDPS